MRIPDFEVSQFGGLNTFIKDKKALKPGVATDSKNWVTGKYGDHIELRRGSALLGATRVSGAGKITGLGIATRADGAEVPFFTHDRKVKYYDAAADDVVEVGIDILPEPADAEDTWIEPYQNLAGSMLYVGGEHISNIKIPAANPGSPRAQSTDSFRFGTLRFNQGRAYAGRRKGSTASSFDNTGLYLSFIDKALLSAYSAITDEAVGLLGSTSYAGNLIQVTGVRTCMYVSIKEATGETLVDDRNGNLIGDGGSTGTINYATGAYAVTFNHTTVGNVTADYYVEDSTDEGPLDFNTADAGAGKAKIFRQDDGGDFMTVLSFLGVDYSIHRLKTWALTTTLDDTESTNLPYRAIGIQYWRSAKETPDGILIIDTANPSDPKVRRLEVGQNTTNLTIVPTPLSDALDLTGHAFDYAVAGRWGDYEIICVQEYSNAVAQPFNSVMYIRNVSSKAWDKLDCRASCLATYRGALLAGDPISSNVFTLFSGFDDDGSPIDNLWVGGQMNLGTDNLKRANFMRLTGLIQTDQQIAVFLTLDDGSPFLAFEIDGRGDYVDSGINTSIGSPVIGSKAIGGGGEATAHPYDVTFPIHTDIFQYVTPSFQALAIGHAGIDMFKFIDIRDKGTRSLPIRTIIS